MTSLQGRNVDSEKLLFEVLSKYRELRDLEHRLERETGTNILRLTRGLSLYGTGWLQDLAILTLYYGTQLSPAEIAVLRHRDIHRESEQVLIIRSSIIKENIEINHENELFAVLSLLISNGNLTNREPLFLNRHGEALHERDIVDLVDRYSGTQQRGRIAPYFSLSADDFAVIPTPLRLNANPRYAGEGVTIAFVDSGFYPHPDLTRPENRILAYVDMTNPQAGWSELSRPDISSWHGMQTSVSACGNGFLSQGLYRGIASRAKVVLIKASGSTSNNVNYLAEGIAWAVKHRHEFNIRIINVSMASDSVGQESEDPVSKAVEEASAAGVVVVAAAGNDPHRPILPPASSLSAITVGGVDDQNTLFQERLRMYHSSFGSPVEGIVKPEIIAPAIWIAAPVLPDSPLYFESLALHKVVRSLDADIRSVFEQNRDAFAKLPPRKEWKSAEHIRRWAEQRIIQQKLIAVHYQHVDGTSFAAPIVASVIAQMLQVNQDLTPKRIKKILIGTAHHLEGISPYVQGFGVIAPTDAVDAALTNNIPTDEIQSPSPATFKNSVTFTYVNPEAEKVDLVGDFNQWREDVDPMQRNKEGVWGLTKDFSFPGRYRYKFLVNSKKWIHDPLNTRVESDGYAGQNSVFFIHTPGNAEEVFERYRKTLRLIGTTDSNERRKAFLDLDNVLQLPLSNRSFRVRQFFARCMEQAVEELNNQHAIEEAIIWQFYNQGYVVRVSHLTFGFDVVTTRHVYNLFWDLEPTIVSSIADNCDILFVTHRHPDHLDLELVNTLISQGKKVIIPYELVPLIPRGAIGLQPDEERVIAFPGRNDEWIRIKAHQGVHVYDQGRNIPIRYYELTTATGMTFLHMGDHDHTAKIAPFKAIDCAFVKCGGISPDISDQESLLRFCQDVPAKLIIPGHINELGHPVKGGRISFETAFSCVDSVEKPCTILGWGESLRVPLPPPKKHIVTPTKVSKKQVARTTRQRKTFQGPPTDI